MNKKLKIIVLSDGSGKTALNLLKAIIAQFPKKQIEITRFKKIRNKEQVDSVFYESALSHQLLIHTVVSEDIRKYITQQAKKFSIDAVDLFGPILNYIASAIDARPSATPNLLRRVDKNYFRKIEAMEFSLQQDNGKNIESLAQADIVLLGVSRTSKSPLGVILSLEGNKVANLPIVLHQPLPPEIFKINQRNIFILSISAESLLEIRKQRKDSSTKDKHDYIDPQTVEQEIAWTEKIAKENPLWPIIDITNRSLEDIAFEIDELRRIRQTNQKKIDRRFLDEE